MQPSNISPRPNRVRRLLASSATFVVMLSLALVLGRIVVYDHHFFRRECIPNHDMSQGFAFCATNLDSFRTSSEPAWWNPIGGLGCAQYFQSFLSPLAPTTHHPVFLVWMHATRALDAVGIRFPEYGHYLAINYVVFPFLAFAGWIALTILFFRSRITVAAVAVVYAFSSIGLWHSAWFYFQEPATLNFLLATFVAACRRPTPRRMSLLILAAVIQAVTLNYWTIYHLFFVGLFVGTYGWANANQIRRLGRRAAAAFTGPTRGRALALTLSASATLAIWAVLLGSIALEQGGRHHRAHRTENERGFSIDYALARVGDVRYFTIEMFNPSIAKAVHNYPRVPENEIHDCRYLGAGLIPFLVLFPAMTWGRRERWLVALAVGTLAICVGCPLFAALWKAVPMMDRIQHLFYFYGHLWQQVVLLIAGCALDGAIRSEVSTEFRRRGQIVLGGLIVIVGVAVGFLFANGHAFARGDMVLQANLLTAMFIGAPTVVLLRLFAQPTPAMRSLVAFVVLGMATADLTRYFREANARDREFTPSYLLNPVALPDEVRERLGRPWTPPDLERGFSAGLGDNAPIHNHFWPVNEYLGTDAVNHLMKADAHAVLWDLRHGPPIEFFASAERQADEPEALKNQLSADRVKHRNVLVVDADVPTASPSIANGTVGRMVRWGYNQFEFEIDGPAEGWVLIRQHFDPRWRVRVDGLRSPLFAGNVAGIAIPVGAGRHRVHLEYRPLARSLFAPACGLLTLFVGVSFIAMRHGAETRFGRFAR